MLLTCSIPIVSMFFSIILENSVDPDQMASSEDSWSGFTVFSKQVISEFIGPVKVKISA